MQPVVAAGGLRLSETNNQNDPLYPGGGANAYNDGAIIASQYINASDTWRDRLGGHLQPPIRASYRVELAAVLLQHRLSQRL